MSKRRLKKSVNTVEIIDLDRFQVGIEDEGEDVVLETAEVIDIHETRSRLMGLSHSSKRVTLTREESTSAQLPTHVEASTPEFAFLEADVFCHGQPESVLDDDLEEPVKRKAPKQRV